MHCCAARKNPSSHRHTRPWAVAVGLKMRQGLLSHSAGFLWAEATGSIRPPGCQFPSIPSCLLWPTTTLDVSPGIRQPPVAQSSGTQSGYLSGYRAYAFPTPATMHLWHLCCFTRPPHAVMLGEPDFAATPDSADSAQPYGTLCGSSSCFCVPVGPMSAIDHATCCTSATHLQVIFIALLPERLSTASRVRSAHHILFLSRAGGSVHGVNGSWLTSLSG
ncbi:hypothetical protein Micbo1qcDRAFT_173624 [Microdochium bolleyi]|uniref:Uncharacterized protein n=1 Tax=Microdochium bolleyi TaxID=196109 RepID=A0A136JCL0_9PEZI|nr:hypothetical protein Micbo1qcDRAFT_173624 [Microdochium bolleyi]